MHECIPFEPSTVEDVKGWRDGPKIANGTESVPFFASTRWLVEAARERRGLILGKFGERV